MVSGRLAGRRECDRDVEKVIKVRKGETRRVILSPRPVGANRPLAVSQEDDRLVGGRGPAPRIDSWMQTRHGGTDLDKGGTYVVSVAVTAAWTALTEPGVIDR